MPSSFARFHESELNTVRAGQAAAPTPVPKSAPPPELTAVKLAWEILPQGHVAFPLLMSHYQRRADAQSSRRWDLSRLEFFQTIGPAECFVGSEDFDGYVVFTFPGKGKAVLDNPLHGNACYIISGEWRELSRLSKQELLGSHAKNVTRVIHRGNWKKRVRRRLRERC